MPKVKMSDIKSGSEKVKAIFRRPMAKRDKELLSIPLSNDELVEVFNVLDNIERQNNTKIMDMYQILIEEQPGPFNDEVFELYLDRMMKYSQFTELLKKSKNISIHNKNKWIDRSIIFDHYSAVSNFFINNESSKYGIDIKKSPYNMRILEALFIYQVTNLHPPDVKDLIGILLSSMRDTVVHEWYLLRLVKKHNDFVVDFLMRYDNIPSITIEHMYLSNKSGLSMNNKETLAMHPNCPPHIIKEIYELTGNDTLLPKDARDIFLF